MKILMFSWRDIKHPYGGGAELLSHEMAKRWVKWGHSVTHFSALFPGGKNKEVIDGVTYLREGNWKNVHVKGFIKIIRGDLPKVDLIIDEVHGIPFFAALYSKTPVVCLACEVAKEVWDQMYPFPINVIGKFFERIYLLLYRKVPFLTISDSTKKDLVDNGIPEKNITVVPMGFSYKLPKSLPKKSTDPTIIFLGRLAKSKGIPLAVKAFSLIRKEFPKSKMIVVGKGEPDFEKELYKLVTTLNLTSSVDFKGFVSQEDKFKFLSESHLILVPSVREGWGLIVPEANIVGTPAVVYNVPGLRDVTKSGINGIIVKKNDYHHLADEAIKLFKNPKKLNSLSDSAKKYSKSMNWDDTAKVAMEVMETT